jgi:acyl-coenzyme A thioesterase PaaI-like protein
MTKPARAGVSGPPGFVPLRTSAFSDHVGPLWVKHGTGLPVVGLHIDQRHANTLGIAHGGLLATVGDVALGQAVKAVLPPGSAGMTADLYVVFLATAAIGDWVEAHTTMDLHSRRLIRATSELRSPARTVAKISGTFLVAGDARGETAAG